MNKIPSFKSLMKSAGASKMSMYKKSSAIELDEEDDLDDFLTSRIQDIGGCTSVTGTIENLQHTVHHLELIKNLYPDVTIFASSAEEGYSFCSKSINALVDQFTPSEGIVEAFQMSVEGVIEDPNKIQERNKISTLRKALRKRNNKCTACNCTFYKNIDIGCRECHISTPVYAMPAVTPLFFVEDNKIHVSYYKEFIDNFGINPIMKEKLTLYLIDFVKSDEDYDLTYLPSFITKLLLFS